MCSRTLPFLLLLIPLAVVACHEDKGADTEQAILPRRASGLYLNDLPVPEASVMEAAAAEVKVHPATRRPRAPRARPASTSNVKRLTDVDAPGGDEMLPPGAVRRVMRESVPRLASCAVAAKSRAPSLREVVIDFGVAGSGRVSTVEVNGATRGPLQGCIAANMRRLKFPAFDGQLTQARFSMTVQ